MSAEHTNKGAPPLWKSLGEITSIGRDAGLIGRDDEFVADVPLFKRAPGLAILGPLHVLFQRSCTLLVTPREVIVTPWATPNNRRPLGPKSRWGDVLRLERPQRLALTDPPKRTHTVSGNKVQLPAPIAASLGCDVVYAASGLMADATFQLAGSPPSR